MSNPSPDPLDSDSISIETVTGARIHASNTDPTECVIQISTLDGRRFFSLHVNELGRLGERMVLDSALLSSGNFIGKA